MIESGPENIPSEHEPKSELDIEKYKKYFDILRRCEAPMGCMPDIERLARGGLPTYKIVPMMENGVKCGEKSVPVENKEEALEELRKIIENMVEGWTIIKNIYDGINLDELDENTGKAILQENKDLINKFHSLFMEAVERILKNPEAPPNIPQELFDLFDRIFENGRMYGKLPAEMAYRRVGWKGIKEDDGMSRFEWFKAGKPTKQEWFKKWLGPEGSGEK